MLTFLIAIVLASAIVYVLRECLISLEPLGPCYVRLDGQREQGIMFISSNPLKEPGLYIAYTQDGAWLDYHGPVEHERLLEHCEEVYALAEGSYAEYEESIAVFHGFEAIDPDEALEYLKGLGDIATWSDPEDETTT